MTWLRQARLGSTAALLLTLAPAWAAPPPRGDAEPAPARFASTQAWTDAIWDAARRNDAIRFERLLTQAPAGLDESLRASIETYQQSIAKREEERARQRAESLEHLEGLLAGEINERSMSEGLVRAVHLLEIARDKEEVFGHPLVREVVARAEVLAREAEDRRDWLTANELFYRLNTLFEDEGYYRTDLDRQNQRLTMIQLYAPEALWRLRSEREVAEGRDPLPPYRPIGDGFEERLEGINALMVGRALRDAAEGHVERVEVREILLGGLSALETMLQTPEVVEALPGLSRHADRLVNAVRSEMARVRSIAGVTRATEINTTLQRLLLACREAEGVPLEAIIHEFANGAMARLDEFSEIIWPDELRSFERNTSGNFEGIGVQIQLDEHRNIRVVTPLDDTPAYAADIRAGDVIVRVDGKPTAGMSLNQAAKHITGPRGQNVTLTIRREIEADDGGREPVEFDVTIRRAQITLKTVKGWRRHDADSGWDWFIDEERGIGYIRLSQFTESSDREFREALSQMRADGLTGLIVDLRFNPGGLLDQAVAIANLFVRQGEIVSTQDGQGRRAPGTRTARPQNAVVTDIPVVFLTNQSSASASEIVAGAVQDHAREGRVDALVVGRRSYGKGSVQNVWGLPGGRAAMKLTKHYYQLPGGRLIHKRQGSPIWGVDPDLDVDMLPSQTLESVLLRRDADVLPLVAGGDAAAAHVRSRPAPERLINEGIDVQLHTALLLLQARTASSALTSRTARTS